MEITLANLVIPQHALLCLPLTGSQVEQVKNSRTLITIKQHTSLKLFPLVKNITAPWATEYYASFFLYLNSLNLDIKAFTMEDIPDRGDKTLYRI